MKIVVCLDNDGHFRAALLSDKLKVFNMIKEHEDGDAWENEKDEVELNELNFSTSTDEEFLIFVTHFVQRGSLEIVTLP